MNQTESLRNMAKYLSELGISALQSRPLCPEFLLTNELLHAVTGACYHQSPQATAELQPEDTVQCSMTDLGL